MILSVIPPPSQISFSADSYTKRTSNFQIFKTLENLGTSLPAQILQQQPVIFRDALDRVAPFHLEFIDSHEAFVMVLKLRFKDVGLRKIQNGEYVLQDVGAGDIDTSRPWKACFFPGQRVNMSITSKQLDKIGSINCPICRHEHRNLSSSSEITW